MFRKLAVLTRLLNGSEMVKTPNVLNVFNKAPVSTMQLPTLNKNRKKKMCWYHIFIMLFTEGDGKKPPTIYPRGRKISNRTCSQRCNRDDVGSPQWKVNVFEQREILQAEMIDGEFPLETMHGRHYPNHPLWKQALPVSLFVKATGENQYIVIEQSFNNFFFFWFVFLKHAFGTW